MNMGIGDAYNLAWKIALVVQGKAPDSILLSYEPERLTVVRDVVNATDKSTKAITIQYVFLIFFLKFSQLFFK